MYSFGSFVSVPNIESLEQLLSLVLLEPQRVVSISLTIQSRMSSCLLHVLDFFNLAFEFVLHIHMQCKGRLLLGKETCKTHGIWKAANHQSDVDKRLSYQLY